MSKKIPTLLAAILGCELVGILGGVFTASAIPVWYQTLQKPSFSPPSWIFGPVWTILYAMMGISAYLIWRSKTARTVFILQLATNLLWSLLFFGLRSPLLALIDIGILWVLILTTIRYGYRISRPAAYLLIPYFCWVSFAAVLNGAIVILNP